MKLFKQLITLSMLLSSNLALAFQEDVDRLLTMSESLAETCTEDSFGYAYGYHVDEAEKELLVSYTKYKSLADIQGCPHSLLTKQYGKSFTTRGMFDNESSSYIDGETSASSDKLKLRNKFESLGYKVTWIEFSNPIQDLANNICNRIILFNDANIGEPWEAFEDSIAAYWGIERSSPNFRTRVTKFWNENHDKMICTDQHIGYNTPQHLLKRVIEMHVIQGFYFDYLLRDQNTNVNAVEYHNGKPETVIDFIDEIINDPTVHPLYSMEQIESLRAFLTQIIGAKTAEELLEEQAQ